MLKESILLVDDDRSVLAFIGMALEEEGYKVTRAENGETALEIMKDVLFDLVVTDLVMEKINGIELLGKVKEEYPETMVIILTGFGEMKTAIEALRNRADDYVLKSSEPEEILYRVARCLENGEMKKRMQFYENILPICCMCKSIRDDSKTGHGKGEWMSIEKFITGRGVMPSHTYCPECIKIAEKDVL